MPKKSPDKTATARIIQLYRILQAATSPLTKADLAARLQCSPEAVRRLLHILGQELGVDSIVTDRNERAEKHSLRSRSPHPLKGLAEEVDLFAQWVDLMGPYLPEGLAARTRAALPRLAMALRDGTTVHSSLPKPEGVRPFTFHSKGYIDYAPHEQTLHTLRDAITKGGVCRVTYHAAGQETPRSHRLLPRRIAVQSGTLYLLGDLLTDGTLLPEKGTTLSVHRIRAVERTGEYIRLPAGGQEAPERHFGLKWHEPRRRAVWIAAPAADYVRDRIWSDDQTITDHPDGSLTLQITTTSDEEFKAWVRGFGDRARLTDMQPAEQETA